MKAGSPAVAALCAILSGRALAQTSGPTFEVATIRISADSNAGGYFSGGPGSRDPTLATFTHVRIGGIVRRAFGIEASYRLVIPSGLPDAWYDIRAKIPPGTDETRFEQMLQNLLSERLGMKAHREMREVAGYEMTLAKTGLRLKAPEQTATPPDSDTPVGALPLIRDRNGEPQLPPGRNARIVVRLSDGRFRHTGRMQSMADIVAMCERELGKPILNRTELTGFFDFNVDFMRTPDEPDQKMDESATPFLTALQAQTGLRLELKKVRTEVVVIDHIEKVPGEN
jgi:uncharacterized protein (TIGR03435 family)